ncbi:MAG TPA: HEPN domain-containing protein [Gemmataceae bacterium]|nr:HEPN domain-containing protein [Gemmataceae bacterium]
MSKLIETRAEFQQLAEERLEEAKALLSLGKWGGAYYLAGYAVELALKACIIKHPMATDAFPAKDFTKDCYTHDLGRLVELANLDGARQIATKADAQLESNWPLTENWSEVKRYHQINQAETEEFFNAVADGVHGVFSWIKTQW